MSMKIGLFYGSTTCYTEMAAEKIEHAIGGDLVTLNNIKDTPLSDITHYDLLLFGISTWDFGELQEDWEKAWPQLDAIDWQDRVIALYGLGDQQGYGEWYLDAMGMLHDKLVSLGAHPIGYWPNQHYEFEASKALTDDGQHFVGLALDEDSQYELSDARIEEWCERILIEYSDILTESYSA